MPKQIHHLALAYIKTLFSFAGSRILKAGTVIFMSGIFQGISLLMLIPLLSVSGMGSATSPDDSISKAVQNMLDTLGLSYSLLGVLALFIALISLEAIFTRYRSIMLTVLSQDFTHHLRNSLYHRIGAASWQFHSTNHSSEAMHLLDNAVNKISSGTFSILQLSVLFIQTLVYLFVAASISLPMTLIMLVTGLILFMLLRPINRKVFRHGKKAVKTNQKLYRNMVEFFSGLKLAKSYNRASQHIDHFEQTGQKLIADGKAVANATATAQMWLRILSVCLLSVFVYVAINIMQIGIEQVLVLIVVVNRLFSAFSSGQNYWQMLLQALPSFDTYQQGLQNFKQHQETIQDTQSPFPRLKDRIRLENISFYYQKHESQPVLKDISVTIPANKTIAITGESGAGKSTLADILMGLLLPGTGSIFIDHTELSPERLDSWREHIAYVPQEVYLFDGSIRSNLQWIDDQVFDDKQLWAALDAAAAGKFIRKLPQQLDTDVGERGVQLSGGERQRIALARALLKKPDLLILDEATSALDHENETRILEALNNLHGSMTIIIIAHRQTTIDHAEMVILLKKGKLTVATKNSNKSST